MDCFLYSLIPYGVPGVDLLIMQNHKTIYRHMAGYRDLEKHLPIQGNELYYFYSCSKAVTAVAALQLYEQGNFFWIHLFPISFRILKK